MLIAADSLKGNHRATLWGDLRVALASFPRFLQPAGLLILAYVGLVVPLTGMGFGLSALSGLRIPNFITSVIYANPLYLSGYTALIILLAVAVAVAVAGALSIFVFHAVLLRGTTVWGGFRFSWRPPWCSWCSPRCRASCGSPRPSAPASPCSPGCCWPPWFSQWPGSSWRPSPSTCRPRSSWWPRRT